MFSLLRMNIQFRFTECENLFSLAFVLIFMIFPLECFSLPRSQHQQKGRKNYLMSNFCFHHHRKKSFLIWMLSCGSARGWEEFFIRLGAEWNVICRGERIRLNLAFPLIEAENLARRVFFCIDRRSPPSTFLSRTTSCFHDENKQ